MDDSEIRLESRHCRSACHSRGSTVRVAWTSGLLLEPQVTSSDPCGRAFMCLVRLGAQAWNWMQAVHPDSPAACVTGCSPPLPALSGFSPPPETLRCRLPPVCLPARRPCFQSARAEGWPCSAYGSGWRRALRPHPPLALPFVLSGVEAATWGAPGPGPRGATGYAGRLRAPWRRSGLRARAGSPAVGPSRKVAPPCPTRPSATRSALHGPWPPVGGGVGPERAALARRDPPGEAVGATAPPFLCFHEAHERLRSEPRSLCSGDGVSEVHEHLRSEPGSLCSGDGVSDSAKRCCTGPGFLVAYRLSSFTRRCPDGPYNSFFQMFDRSTQREETLEASRENSRPQASLQPHRVCAGRQWTGEVSVGSLQQQEDPAHVGTRPRVSPPWPPPASQPPVHLPG
ncbi:unnamed protein product [Rangifer tarandus platyrhynchus]|uniref:Uncharacterized protein n=1 Tax=Rangifer tarandus platyrhynchus TaxID=3082113 RepID=A0ABN8ZXR7_RANTA|nr:unnamed protein product [Rangifer tarandus platyrhynchus]